jgi:CO/xanthine dehydrogenase FAD-binding subunit
MITNYYRPQTIQEALKLLEQPNTFPLGGGTELTQRKGKDFSVVDLQALKLDTIRKSGNHLVIGATVTLQTLLEYSSTSEALRTAIKLETPMNLRTIGTIAGTLATCDGRSAFGTVMLALDTTCILINNDPQVIHLGNFLPVRNDYLHGKLITEIKIPLSVGIAFESVSRSPGDKPIVSVALAKWASGRTRLALGGWGKIPILAMDGNDINGLETAAKNTFRDASDERASSEYRCDVAAILASRCLAKTS